MELQFPTLQYLPVSPWLTPTPTVRPSPWGLSGAPYSCRLKPRPSPLSYQHSLVPCLQLEAVHGPGLPTALG